MWDLDYADADEDACSVTFRGEIELDDNEKFNPDKIKIKDKEDNFNPMTVGFA